MAVDVLAPLADIEVPAGAPAAIIDLATAFDLVDVTGTVVRFSSNVSGDIFAELFDAAGPGRARTTPETVANFLAYVDAGLYTNTIVHRSIDNFVVQTGGFGVTPSGEPIFGSIQQFASVVNEPGNSNVRGTLAMAKLADLPNSGTNQFFFNLGDNSANLDGQNGGFTAFARVLGSGMTVVDSIAGVPKFNRSTADGIVDPAPIGFPDIPLVDYTTNDPVTRDNLVTITSVVRVGELVFAATSSNPSLATPTINPNGSLGIAYSETAGGVATITVRATSVFDPTDFTEEQFTVTVAGPTTDPDPEPPPVGQESIIVTGSDIGGASQPFVTVMNPNGGFLTRFLAYEPTFRGGVRVAVADVVPGGTPEIITAPGPGRVGEIRVFLQDGTELPAYRTLPFTASYRGGVEVAAGDINGDNTADIVAAASRGPGLVTAFFVSPTTADPVPDVPNRSFRAFPARFRGGATVATADIGTFAGGSVVDATAADGKMEVVVGSGVGMPPRIRIYDLSVGARVVQTITPFVPTFRGGLSVSAARFDADPLDDIIVSGGFGSGSRIEVHAGRSTSGAGGLLATRQAFAAFGQTNLPVFAAAIPQPLNGRFDAIATVQGGAVSGQGARRLGLTVQGDTLLANLAGPLRIAASRPGV